MPALDRFHRRAAAAADRQAVQETAARPILAGPRQEPHRLKDPDMHNAVTRSMVSAGVAACCAAGALAADIGPSIESCVSQQGAIRFDAIDQRVELEPDDQTRVQAEMEQRYPVLARHGFPVSKIILWHKKNGESVFITLLEHPTKPAEACFTATFAAARFSGIETLRRKYLRPELQI